jgi:hypothetical protein
MMNSVATINKPARVRISLAIPVAIAPARARACTVVFNVEALKVFKGVICKKILEPSLREETPLARKSSSNRRLTSHCTNLSSVLSI